MGSSASLLESYIARALEILGYRELEPVFRDPDSIEEHRVYVHKPGRLKAYGIAITRYHVFSSRRCIYRLRTGCENTVECSRLLGLETSLATSLLAPSYCGAGIATPTIEEGLGVLNSILSDMLELGGVILVEASSLESMKGLGSILSRWATSITVADERKYMDAAEAVVAQISSRVELHSASIAILNPELRSFALARALEEKLGARIRAVYYNDTTVILDREIDIGEIEALIEEGNDIRELEGARLASPEEALSLASIVIIAAGARIPLEKLSGRIVLEASDTIEPKSEDRISRNGGLVIPVLLTDAAYLHSVLPRHLVSKPFSKAFEDIWDLWENQLSEKNYSIKTAAITLATKLLLEEAILSGLL